MMNVHCCCESGNLCLTFCFAYANVYGVINDEATLWVIDSSNERHFLMTPSWTFSTECAL